MKLYARARTPDGGLVRMSYAGENGAVRSPAESGRGAEEIPRDPGRHVSPVDDGLSWWERWGMLGALEPSGYQRLF